MGEQDLKDGRIFYKGINISDEDNNLINLIVNKINGGNLILFLGAAINSPSPVEFESVYSNCPPMGHQLADALSRAVNYNDKYPDEKYPTLSRVAQYYELQNDRPLLVQFLRSKIDGKRPSPLLYALADLPFKQIITTNYDKLFEDAMKSPMINKNPLIGVYTRNRAEKTVDFNEAQITEQTPFLYKMHGDISNGDSMVISDEDYIHFILRMSDKEDYNPIPHSFTTSFGNKSILFIGYGLLDYNLRLLFKSTMWGKDVDMLPKSCSIDKKPDSIIRKLFDKKYSINFIVEDAWKIIPIIYSLIKGKEMPLEWNSN